MPLTNEQLADAILNDGLQKRFRGQLLRLAGYVKNGDAEGLSAPIKTLRLAWANKVLAAADGNQHLVDSAARVVRWAAAVDGTLAGLNDAASVTDGQIESIVATLMENATVLGAL